MGATANKGKRRLLTTLPLAFVTYCGVSGGPYGLEPLVNSSGALWAIVLLLVLPIIWALPDALTTAELASAIPEEGGYTVWVQRAIGPFPAFLDAWWTWLYSLVDCAIYPALFIHYASAALKLSHITDFASQPLAEVVLVFLVVGGMTLLNVRGARPVGVSSGVFTFAILLPFAALCGIAAVKLAHGQGHLSNLTQTPAIGAWAAITAGLPVAMWNYQGWNTISTFAGEVENPAKAYPKALAVGLAATTAGYLLPIVATLPFTGGGAAWTDQSWPILVTTVAGPTLGLVVAAAALASQLGLLNAGFLASTRIPIALAQERYLPKFLAETDTKSGTPLKTLWLTAVLVAALTYWSLKDLLTLNVILFSSALLLEGISLVVLRKKAPDMPRPFRIPGGYPVVVLIAVLPVALSVILVVSQVHDKGWAGQILTGIALVSGPILYAIARKVRVSTASS